MTTRRTTAGALALAAALLWMPPGRGAPFVHPFAERVDALVREGYERPDAALAELERLLAQARSPDDERSLLQATGSIEAGAGRAGNAASIADRLRTMPHADGDRRGEAAALIVEAEAAENADRLDLADPLAQAALDVFEKACPPVVANAGDTGGEACDPRSAWRALQILQRRSESPGRPAAQAARAEAALALSEWAGDSRRQVIDLGALAVIAQAQGDRERSLGLLKDATRLAVRSGEDAQLALSASTAARVAHLRGDDRLALHWHEEAQARAVLAKAPRLEARMLNDLSDAYARLGRPADALRAAERALPIVQGYGDRRAERALTATIGIAKIGLGRIAEGRQDLARLLASWQRGGEPGREAGTLVEFGEALAAAGDERTALELYHRERTLSAELMRADRELALKELQVRDAAAARRRDIELVAIDNALKSAVLSSRDLQRSIGWVLSAVMLLATVLVVLLYRRVRGANRELAASQTQLRIQSERDPLTNLANRRQFQSVVERPRGGDLFEGALLLVDIDHFKHVNDAYGHSAGDAVLVEVARRLDAAVRSGDLVARWGGEEFLILLPHATREQAAQMAERLLVGIGHPPIHCGGHALQVTASIGHARFPLGPHDVALSWEQAVNLVDMALYTAKNQGRNRAVGIVSTTAATKGALRDIEADFDRACHDGRVVLRHSRGPEMVEQLRAA